MKKRIVALLIVLCLVCGMIPAVSAAQVASGTCGENLTWVLTDDGTITISGSGYMDSYSDSEGWRNPWYSHSAAIKKVVIENGVISIGDYAFWNCVNLTTVSIANSVTDIWYGAFENCVKLSSVTFPDSITHICVSAFSKCYALTEVTIPVNANICELPFYDCDNLKAIHVADGNPYLSSDNGVLLNKDRTYLYQCPGGYEGTYAIPDTVVDSWYDAFYRCCKLTGVYIPASLGENPPYFDGCSALSDVTFAEGVTTVGGFSYGCDSLTEITLPQSLTTIKPYAFDGTYITNFEIPAGVRYLGERSLDNFKLRTVTFTGDAPQVYNDLSDLDGEGNYVIPFGGLVSIYYPADNPTWTKKARDDISTTAKWIPYGDAVGNPFADVKSSDYYYEPVLWAVDEGITSGITPTEFSPYDSCLRSQVVTFLWRAAGEPKAKSKVNPFVDVKPTDYYYDAVLWAVEQGITTGADATHFEPNGVCNRSQVVTFLYRAFEKPPVSNASNPFTDVSAGSWYAAPVLWAVKEGITNGLSDTQFGPNEVCNRSQVVTFLYRAYN